MSKHLKPVIGLGERIQDGILQKGCKESDFI